MANTAAERELTVSVKPGQHPETRGDSDVCYVAVNLTPHSAHAPLTKVQVTLVVKAPLAVDPPTHTIHSLSKWNSHIINLIHYTHYCLMVV